MSQVTSARGQNLIQLAVLATTSVNKGTDIGVIEVRIRISCRPVPYVQMPLAEAILAWPQRSMYRPRVSWVSQIDMLLPFCPSRRCMPTAMNVVIQTPPALDRRLRSDPPLGALVLAPELAVLELPLPPRNTVLPIGDGARS